MTQQLVAERIIIVRPRETRTGSITALLKLTNVNDPSKSLSVQALVGTGAAYITLPAAWRERFGKLYWEEQVLAGMADGSVRKASFGGPLHAQINDLRRFSADVLFLEMEPGPEGEYQPLIGYMALQEAGVALDMPNERLIQLPYVDVK